MNEALKYFKEYGKALERMNARLLASFPLKFMEPRKPTKRQVKPRKSFPVGNTKGDNA